MYDFSMIQLIRRYGKQLDRSLREQILHHYRPFRKMPCFLHSLADRIIKSTRKHPVIIEFAKCDYSFHELVSQAGQAASRHRRCRIKHQYSSIMGCSAELTAAGMEDLLQSCKHVKKIYPDREVKALLDHAVPSVRADTLNQTGLTGEGITIAVVDTGIDPHDDLLNPSNRIVAFQDFVGNRAEPYDDNGHGTHCAGDAAGNGFRSGGQYAGPAPEANLVGVKVLNKKGAGSLSDVIAGIQWCIDHKDTYEIQIISLSLGSQAVVPAEEDPVVHIVERAWEAGIFVCVAAGNEGPRSGTIASPGISPVVLTVGAMDDNDNSDRSDDEVADFSSRGPTIDHLVKPDLLAPGVNIVSLRVPGSYLDKLAKANRVGEHYIAMSGTSMATPIAAGIAALILQKYKGLAPAEVKRLLTAGAEDWSLPENVQGHGYADASNSIEL